MVMRSPATNQTRFDGEIKQGRAQWTSFSGSPTYREIMRNKSIGTDWSLRCRMQDLYLKTKSSEPNLSEVVKGNSNSVWSNALRVSKESSTSAKEQKSLNTVWLLPKSYGPIKKAVLVRVYHCMHTSVKILQLQQSKLTSRNDSHSEGLFHFWEGLKSWAESL